MSELTIAVLQRHWPHGDQHVPGLIEGIIKAAPIVFPKYGLGTPTIIAPFMAHASYECGAGVERCDAARRAPRVF